METIELLKEAAERIAGWINFSDAGSNWREDGLQNGNHHGGECCLECDWGGDDGLPEDGYHTKDCPVLAAYRTWKKIQNMISEGKNHLWFESGIECSGGHQLIVCTACHAAQCMAPLKCSGVAPLGTDRVWLPGGDRERCPEIRTFVISIDVLDEKIEHNGQCIFVHDHDKMHGAPLQMVIPWKGKDLEEERSKEAFVAAFAGLPELWAKSG